MNSKTYRSILGPILLSLWLPAAAELHVENLVVNRSGPAPQSTNIRVNLINDGSELARPNRVVLSTRENPGTAWRTVKTWSGTHYIETGDRRSFDYLPSADDRLDPALSQATYELQVVVSGKSGPMTTMSITMTRGTSMNKALVTIVWLLVAVPLLADPLAGNSNGIGAYKLQVDVRKVPSRTPLRLQISALDRAGALSPLTQIQVVRR